MAYTTINKPTDYFSTNLWVADDATSRSFTGFGHQPDFVWVKHRGSGNINHTLTDSVRGGDKMLFSNTTAAEDTKSHGEITSFNSDGITVADGTNSTYPRLYFNDLNPFGSGGGNYVGWSWKAGGTASSNTDGSITSSVSANTTAGFSIVTWTGSGSDATIGHGLSSAPEMYVVKNRSDSSTNWRVGQTVAGNTMTGGNGYYMEWDDTKASTNPGSAVTWGSTPTAPTSSVFTVGSNNSHNGSSDNMLAYCFHSVKGYSKIGSYIGNGNANGTFVYTGFKPAWVMMKRTDGTSHWRIFDNKREGYNVDNDALKTNASDAETTTDFIDLLSNGFKLRSTDSAVNGSGSNFIYMALAVAPLVGTNNVPATAR